MTWIVKVEFESMAKQEELDPEDRFPYDNCSRVIAYASKAWGMLPEDIMEDFDWSDDQTKLTMKLDVIDALPDVLNYICMSTLPVKIEVTRDHDYPKFT